MGPLTVCAIFKNEAPYLLEWIAYHRTIGFDHFVLYDNDSTDGGPELIRGSWAAACTTLIPWPRRPGQLPAFRHFIYNLAQLFDWAAFIDLDEFLLPLAEGSIRPILQDCVGFSAVAPCWRVFGPSGWDTPPAGLVLERSDMRAPDGMPVNAHMKSISRCADLLGSTPNPHEFVLKGPICNSLGAAVPNIGIQPKPVHRRLVINHYVTRSRQDWMAKIKRGSAAIETGDLKYRAELFEHYTEISTIRDVNIQRFLPAVRAVLAEPPGAPGPLTPPLSQALTVVAHIALVGDADAPAGSWIGRRGSGVPIEGIELRPGGDLRPEDVALRVVLSRDIASDWMQGGSFGGSRGAALPVRGVAVRLQGEAARRYACSYRATFIGGAAVGPVADGVLCATPDLAPLEALRIDLTPR